jgi:hypothetical protein
MGLKGKDDSHVYMAAKKDKRILITYDQNIYTNSRKYSFFEDLGLIYLTCKKGSYDLLPEEIEARLKRLFFTIKDRDEYYNVKMKLSDNQVEIKSRNGEIRRIRF